MNAKDAVRAAHDGSDGERMTFPAQRRDFRRTFPGREVT